MKALLFPTLVLALPNAAWVMEVTVAYHYILLFLLIATLVLMAGLMSGLTVGMMGLSELDLELKLAIGSPTDKAFAGRVLPLLHRHHLLLVTLLLCNAAATETLPIVLCGMVSEPVAMLIATALVVTFGEILPLAFCTGPEQLWIAARCSFLVRVVMCVFFPIAWPISLVLDWLFKEELPQESSAEAKHLLAKQSDDLSEVQVRIIHSAMRGRESAAKAGLLELSAMHSLSLTTQVDACMLQELRRKGYSHVPVYVDDTKKDLAGVLRVKDLLAVHKEAELGVTNVQLERCIVAPVSLSFISLFHLFRSKRTHMIFLVTPGPTLPDQCIPIERVLGVVTQRAVLKQLVSLSDSRQQAAGLLQRSLNPSKSSLKGKLGHMQFISPRAGVLFHHSQTSAI